VSATYKSAGVDIKAGDETIEKIKPYVKSTYNKNVLNDIGLFGGFFEAKFEGINEPVLVSSVDGVGTKLKIAFLTGKHHTIGQCLVNHCTNDILCCGASPLFFLDYFATGKLDPGVTSEVIRGFTIACKENGCALIGGETAEMPSMYQIGEYDVSGTIVGVVDKSKILNGSKIQSGDILIGLRSTGLHTNGYSLARKVLLEKHDLGDYFPELGATLGESLLSIHRSYLKVIKPLLDQDLLHGISHITGGGIVGNTKRILREGLNLKINWNAWEWLPIFKIIQEVGEVETNEMREVFNLGIGMILIAEKGNVDRIMELCHDNEPVIMGEIK
jgi:phosphoribosylformylglycinamidine cyclo-ligase